MGWLYQNDPLRPETPARYFRRAFTHDTQTHAAAVIATATVRGTVYAAIRNHDKVTGHSYVFCAVIIFRNNEKDGFGYKDMDEAQGPAEADCPERILTLLSPIETMPNPEYAAAWRERVRARLVQRASAAATTAKIRAALKPGFRLEFPRPIRYPGREITHLRFHHWQRRTPVFETIDGPPCSAASGATVSRPPRSSRTSRRLVHRRHARKIRSKPDIRPALHKISPTKPDRLTTGSRGTLHNRSGWNKAPDQ